MAGSAYDAHVISIIIHKITEPSHTKRYTSQYTSHILTDTFDDY